MPRRFLLGNPPNVINRYRTTVSPEARSPRALLAGAMGEIGRQTKRLINATRAAWLRRHGWEVGLHQYCPEAVTPENTILKASRSMLGGGSDP